MKLNSQIIKRDVKTDPETEIKVRAILEDVRINGDRAIKKYNKMFDKYLGDFVISTDENCTDANFLRILKRAKRRIEFFHRRQVPKEFCISKKDGTIMGQFARPIERAAVYVPGCTAAYPSSVLMNIIPALIAGVKEIVVLCPNPTAEVISAVALCGIQKIYRIGGAQAIAAAAYGTQTIKKADKIVGPGNIWVATAKRFVSGIVAVDMVAGPSEILIIADESANPAYIAADLISQAEHDKMASSVLVTTSAKLIRATEIELDKQIQNLSRKDIIYDSLSRFGSAILAQTTEEAFNISNDFAPEHLEILLPNPAQYLSKVKNAGSIFLGEYTPEPIGDYMGGTNHVLPTNKNARFSSPLSVYDFVKYSAYSYFSRDAFMSLAADTAQFANREGLTAHAKSITIRK